MLTFSSSWSVHIDNVVVVVVPDVEEGFDSVKQKNANRESVTIKMVDLR